VSRSPFAPAVEAAWETFARIVNAETSLPVEERIKHALAEIIAPKNELLRRRAEMIAEPISQRHDVTVASIFGRSRVRYITAARDELCAELLARDWSQADVARALGLSSQAPLQAATRHRERAAVAKAARRDEKSTREEGE
jgi:hypothetical protein